MKLDQLIAGASIKAIRGDSHAEITGLSYDSRKMAPGDLFFALARDSELNRAHMDQALDRGARAIVVGGWDGMSRPATTIIECERPRLLMAQAASRFYARPSERLELVGITGTSGKTTTAYLLASIFEAAGRPAGIIGTTGVFAGGRMLLSGLTTPESIDFEAALAEMEQSGISSVAAEISSIGLNEGRAEELNFSGCIFTNLGRDHLDYHLTLENYFAAKLRLFTEILPASRRLDSVAIVRGDDPYGRRILDAFGGRKISFGLNSDLDVHPVSFTAGLDGIGASISALGRKLEVHSPLLGEINLLNILGASAMSVALGIETEAVVEGVRRCPGAPGRLEKVPALPGVTVLVDYAHKPDALAAALTNLRGFQPSRLICVFGCGGNRDRGKRPLMGEIAARLADVTIITSDNPRSEDPAEIIAQIEAGASRFARPATQGGERIYQVEADRRTAIGLALETARRGDIVLIAGKGHEDYQIIGATKRHFDDREVVRDIVANSAAASLNSLFDLGEKGL